MLRFPLCSILFGLSLAAAPVQWTVGSGGNGHYYDVVIMGSSPTVTWADADLGAMALGGYLATVTSSAENAFVNSIIPGGAFYDGVHGPHLGGYQPPGSPEPAGGWAWVTGEPWSFTNWGSGEPNDLGGEHYLHIKSTGWNDLGVGGAVNSYVVEWDFDPLAVPEPASWMLVFAGLPLLAAARRR